MRRGLLCVDSITSSCMLCSGTRSQRGQGWETPPSPPVLPGLLTPRTYLHPQVIKSGTQYNLTIGVCVCSYQLPPIQRLSLPFSHSPSRISSFSWSVIPICNWDPFLAAAWPPCTSSRSPLPRRTLGPLSGAVADRPWRVAWAGLGWDPLHNSAGCRLLTLSGGSGTYFRPL